MARPFGVLKQVFLACFELVVTRFRPQKVPKSLENGLFGYQKRVKKGSKLYVSQSDPRPLGMLQQVCLTHCEPVVTRFGPCKIRKCLEKGRFLFWPLLRLIAPDSMPIRPSSRSGGALAKSKFWFKNSPLAARGLDAKLGVPLPNLRSFEPKTAISAQNSPKTRAKRPYEGKRWLHYTCGLTSLCQRAL